jgi:aryl-alcohol dehydrogenase-like predicted oxidoreductase
MEYVQLGKSGIRVSPLCLGTMMFGGAADEATSIRILHRAIDDGINFIDTANVYNGGEAELVLGKGLKDCRSRVVLATKVAGGAGSGPNDTGTSRAHIMKAVEDSLRRLATDYIDLYIIHRPVYTTPLEETLMAMDDLVKQGKIRYIGLSNHYAWHVCEALWIADKRGLSPAACVQPLYNIVNRDAEVDLFPMCQRHGIGVMIYSPLARGVLTGKYLPGGELPEGSRAARGDRRIHETELREESIDVAAKLQPLAERHGKTLSQFVLNWALENPIVNSAIIGPRTMEQYEDNIGSIGWSIDREALDEVDRLVPPGEHTGYGFADPSSPVMGRPPRNGS